MLRSHQSHLSFLPPGNICLSARASDYYLASCSVLHTYCAFRFVRRILRSEKFFEVLLPLKEDGVKGVDK
jgi:hypothetical protein